MFRLAAAFGVAVSLLFTFVSPAEAQAVTKPSVLIGVWFQPASSFAKWKARGINTMVGYVDDTGLSEAQWTKAARDAGLFYMLRPAATVSGMIAQAQDPYLLAWMLPDEPDGGGNLAPADTIALYKQYKSVAANLPVFINFDGGVMQYRAASDYKKYVTGADWLAFDLYIANRGNAPAQIPLIGTRTSQLNDWGKKEPVFAFIECCDQKLYLQDWVQSFAWKNLMRGPTAAEMKSEIDQATSHGADGIIYFPDVIGQWWEAFDGTPPDLEAAMIEANTKLLTKYHLPTPQPKPVQSPPTTQRAKVVASTQPSTTAPDWIVNRMARQVQQGSGSRGHDHGDQ